MRSVTAMLLILLVMMTVGCSQPIESTARDGIASASGFLKQEVPANTSVCQANPALEKCVAIKKASQSLNVVIDALELYCSGPAFNSGSGPCQSPIDPNQKNQLSSKLSGALTDLSRDVADAKKLAGVN